jgi:multiple sugar transport system permease protein
MLKVSAQSSAQPGVAVARRRPRLDLLPYLLVAPAVLLVLSVAVYPALFAMQLSTTDANLLKLASQSNIGSRNYVKTFSDAILQGAALGTLRWVSVVATAQLAVSLPIALFLNINFRGRGLVRAAIVVPWVVSPAVVAILWRFMVDGNFGIINDILVRLHIISEYVPWLSGSGSSFVVLVAAQTWSGFPFFAITLLAALQAIPDDMYESARLDGAGAFNRFRYLTLPLLIPTILLLLLLRTIWLSHSVDTIFLLTNGGPGYANYTVALYSFLLTWNQLELGYPSAIAIMLSVVLLIAASVYVRFIERTREWM